MPDQAKDMIEYRNIKNQMKREIEALKNKKRKTVQDIETKWLQSFK